MTTLQDHKILLDPSNQHWWFKTPTFEILPRRKFVKACRNHAYVFAIVKMPEDIWLPGEEEEEERKDEKEKLLKLN
jgi:hypothetical protein